ncbi:hypothetical protein MJ561_28390 [Klebsiella pneumoniae]|nr:hypothetical protein MJ561_28390 [Klebsiella pneumoniae]
MKWRAAITSVFSATDIHQRRSVDGITRSGQHGHHRDALLIRGKSRTIRRIQSIHYLDRKDPIQQHIL